jgi:hypothetical protein
MCCDEPRHGAEHDQKATALAEILGSRMAPQENEAIRWEYCKYNTHTYTDKMDN